MSTGMDRNLSQFNPGRAVPRLAPNFTLRLIQIIFLPP